MPNSFPEMPLDAWRPTKNTLHLYCQIVGKIRLDDASADQSLVARAAVCQPARPDDADDSVQRRKFRDRVRFRDAQAGDPNERRRGRGFRSVRRPDGRRFLRSVFSNLAKLGIEPEIKAIPYEAPSTTPFPDDTENKSYDKEYVERFHQILVAVDDILKNFAAGSSASRRRCTCSGTASISR